MQNMFKYFRSRLTRKLIALLHLKPYNDHSGKDSNGLLSLYRCSWSFDKIRWCIKQRDRLLNTNSRGEVAKNNSCQRRLKYPEDEKKTVFAHLIHSKCNLESYNYNTIPLSESIMKILATRAYQFLVVQLLNLNC